MYYSEKFSKGIVVDFSQFFRGVEKFNKIANPDGVNIEKQIPIIESELQEILDSKTAVEFVDGLCDSLFTLGPLLEDIDWMVLGGGIGQGSYNMKLSSLRGAIKSFSFNSKLNPCKVWDDLSTEKYNLLDLLSSTLYLDKNYYKQNLMEVVNSNLSKFIPVRVELKDTIIPPELELVKKKYPDSKVEVTYTKFEGVTYAVFKDENGKVLKGHTHYFDPHIITDF